MAQIRQVAFFTVEATWTNFNIGGTWWGIRVIRLEVAGIDFMLS